MSSSNPTLLRPAATQPVLLLAAFLAFAASPNSAAAGVWDPAGDILSTYINQATAQGDLDVLYADFLYNPGEQTFTFSGTMAAAIGTTPGAFYVFGVDRGQGTARFVSGSPSVGAGVIFDSVVVLRPDTSVTVNDIFNAKATNLGLGIAHINGNTISATINASLLPELGVLTKANYTANLWPRVGSGNNNQLTDFAPNASNFSVTVVPEPASLAMAVFGLGVTSLAAATRRKRI